MSFHYFHYSKNSAENVMVKIPMLFQGVVDTTAAL